MFIAFIVKLCIFNNFELMTFYHVQGPKSCIFDIDKNRFKKGKRECISMPFDQLITDLW